MSASRIMDAHSRTLRNTDHRSDKLWWSYPQKHTKLAMLLVLRKESMHLATDRTLNISKAQCLS